MAQRTLDQDVPLLESCELAGFSERVFHGRVSDWRHSTITSDSQLPTWDSHFVLILMYHEMTGLRARLFLNLLVALLPVLVPQCLISATPRQRY